MEQQVSSHLQDSILFLLITDNDFAKGVVGQLQIEFFNSEVTQLVFKIARTFIQKYKRAPGRHFQDELLTKITKWNDDKRELVARYLNYLQEIEPNKDYVLSKLNEFILQRSLIDATYKFADLLENNRYEEAIAKMQKAIKSGIGKQDIGADYFTGADLEKRRDKPERLLELGISYIDRCVRLQRGDLVTIAGVQKGGKSWFCHYIAYKALMQGLSVLHISHENSEEETLKRYDMMIGALVDNEQEEEIEFRSLDDGILKKKYLWRESVYNKEKVLDVRKKLSKFGGKLIVKKYPMGSCTPFELLAYIENLENFQNFHPDVVINDYADIMKPFDSMKQTRDNINEIYIFLKGIADDKKLLMVTPSQVNDVGSDELKRNYKFDGTTLSEDRRKFANIDRGFYITDTIEEENDYGFKEVIIGCFANRNGPQTGRILIGQNLRIGRFMMYAQPYTIKNGKK